MTGRPALSARSRNITVSRQYSAHASSVLFRKKQADPWGLYGNQLPTGELLVSLPGRRGVRVASRCSSIRERRGASGAGSWVSVASWFESIDGHSWCPYSVHMGVRVWRRRHAARRRCLCGGRNSLLNAGPVRSRRERKQFARPSEYLCLCEQCHKRKLPA